MSLFLINFKVASKTDNVSRPKKSNFIKPIFSKYFILNWETGIEDLAS